MALVDMAKKPQELAKEAASYGAIQTPAGQSIYPYGLTLCLTHDELEKLGLDDECEVDDYLDIRALAKVTSRSKNETADGTSVRIELQITHMDVENESEEGEGDDDEEEEERLVPNIHRPLGRNRPY